MAANNLDDPRVPVRAPRPTPAKITGVLAATVVTVALAIAAYALTRLDSWGERGTAIPRRFQFDVEGHVQVPPEWLAYTPLSSIPTGLEVPRALAVAADGTILVVGDQALVRWGPDGTPLGQIALPQAPQCLAVSADPTGAAARIYVGCGRRVIVLNTAGEILAQWPDLDEASVLTAIAATSDHVMLADAGQREVRICDREGNVLRRIGAPDPDRNMPGFVVPSAHFDLTRGDDDTLWVVNPGMRRIECYTLAGELQAMWGSAGSELSDFFGCCNPVYLDRLPDGRFVTSEKGIPRIKIYSESGEFVSVVAGPAELDLNSTALVDASGAQSERVFDVAVRHDGAVLVLDPRQRCIRVFGPRTRAGGPT